MTRRSFALLGATALAGCSKSSASEIPLSKSAASAAPPPSKSAAPDAAPDAPGWTWRSIHFPASDDQPDGQAAELLSPKGACSLPTIVALHGRGESGHGLDAGAHGWETLYELARMPERLHAPPITSDDVKGFLDDARLAAINRSLAKAAYEGLCVACPYTPNLGLPDDGEVQPFARFVVNQLLPKASSLTGAPRKRDNTGIDGVSMGGRLAMLVGFTHPDAFASIGAMQPQINVAEAPMFAELARKAHEKHPFAFRLVSSDGDPFLDSVRALDKELTRVGVPHETIVTAGPHDYIWNKGPGGCEMLLFHERVLRGLDPPW
jgi:hypothetical protein